MIPIRDTAPCYTKPYVTWALIFICISLFLLLEFSPDQFHHYVIYIYGMVPARYTNPEWAIAMGYPVDYYFSCISNLFLHGGWWHLIMNMWFLWIFADNIEDRMGHGRFIVFYLLCGFIATMVQWFYTPGLVVPVVGASGAIAGVLGAYFFLYPYAKIVLWVPILFLPIFVEVPAIAFIGIWVIFQMSKVTTAIMFYEGASDVALWAHLGGFIAGFLLFQYFLRKDYPA
ncbi:rhomboid family intramembrane serine protease [Methylococcaceae bacterium CS1]|nr:rhomboid family intramembrane serine protease [Methyloprofundus sp.]TXK97063.1 rhomboid family intramembrane serine protease [Methylococcaceae bacterium CS4]TXK99365.1 rhomboid family intramembrane serine protease [Methylococcaceae bacterium CS5]TXL05045.1 rhomboid family intramembrane serine protease [Methylococcaceae bacterium CS1]TXL05697.1 rhomboid family intramembrane serine protease [Methylococcaceae bacterium CS3]TXL09980.1 rhomboid family intramembrane serine protease [Methylococcac